MQKHDLILRGGHVIDPISRLSACTDVGIQNGRISAVGNLSAEPCTCAIDATGLYVVPGLVDAHAHVYPKPPFHRDMLPCVYADAVMPQNGVTTVVDAGTCGVEDFPDFYEHVITRSKVRIFSYLNIFPGGMLHLAAEGENATFAPQETAAMAKAYAGSIVGIKSAHYRPFPPFDSIHPPWASVDAALQAGDKAGLPAMLDVIPAPPERSYPALLARMRSGDIHAHVYAPHIPILDSCGTLMPYMRESRDRGGLFDLAHGGQSFSFAHAKAAFQQGFYPDFISSDLYMDNILGPSVGLLHVMSKCLALGMPIEEAVYRTTLRPATKLGLPGVGQLVAGAVADVAVLRFVKEAVGFTDASHARLPGEGYLSCRLTLLGGQPLYDPYGMCAVHNVSQG